MSTLPSAFRSLCGPFSSSTSLSVPQERVALQLLQHAKTATCRKRTVFTERVRDFLQSAKRTQRFYAYTQNPDSAAAYIPFFPTFTCPDEERVGNLLGSGKWVCGVHRLPISCLVYSFGSLTDLSFERTLKYRAPQCEIHLFNPRECLVRASGRCPGAKLNAHFLTYHRVAITPHEGSPTSFQRSFSQIVQSLNHTKVDVLMLDIGNGDEVLVLRSILASSPRLAIPIGQLLIRFYPSSADYSGGEARFQGLRDLVMSLNSAGFQLFHAEPALLSLPVVELSFVNMLSLPHWLRPECA